MLTTRSGGARGLAGSALCALILSALAAAATTPPKPPARGAVQILQGLRLYLSVPRAYYGPGDPVALYLTLVHSGSRPIRLPAGLPLVAVWTVAEKEETFPQDAPEQVSGPPPGADGSRVLKPGERAVFRLTVRPPRSALIHGLYPLRACCDLTSSLGGTLASETTTVKIQYKVMVVF